MMTRTALRTYRLLLALAVLALPIHARVWRELTRSSRTRWQSGRSQGSQ